MNTVFNKRAFEFVLGDGHWASTWSSGVRGAQLPSEGPSLVGNAWGTNHCRAAGWSQGGGAQGIQTVRPREGWDFVPLKQRHAERYRMRRG